MATANKAKAASTDSTDAVVKAKGETVNDDTTFVVGHDGKRYTSDAYAQSDEVRGIVKDES